MQLEITTKGAVVVIGIRGDMTAVTGGAIEDAYRGMTRDGARKILFFFAKDCYINSGGIAILIGIASASRKNGQSIRAAGLSDHFQKIFNMMGLTKYVAIFSTEEEALKDF
ncbi:MAG: anti-sigma-factor antagonist [Deltaproteobacteria bacterium]|nr:anti-sigma-factor antagonist [Deltaproteobacteria bacterium]